MNDSLKWSKLKKENIPEAEKLLRENEADYVGACGRYLYRDAAKDPVWVLGSKKSGLCALLINSKSALMPVFPGMKDMPAPEFIGSFLGKKNIHSVQGLKNEVQYLQETLDRKGKKMKDVIEYELMSLDSITEVNMSKKYPSNLELCIPQLKDAQALAPLQANYEKEEVIPRGSVFNPSSSRLNTANIIKNGKILAAKLDGRFVGKINVNAESFSRYQIGGVYVCSEFRGQGIAGKMTHEFIKSLLVQGRGLTLFVKKANIPALRLYKSLGFTARGDYRITYY